SLWCSWGRRHSRNAATNKGPCDRHGNGRRGNGLSLIIRSSGSCGKGGPPKQTSLIALLHSLVNVRTEIAPMAKDELTYSEAVRAAAAEAAAALGTPLRTRSAARDRGAPTAG